MFEIRDDLAEHQAWVRVYGPSFVPLSCYVYRPGVPLCWGCFAGSESPPQTESGHRRLIAEGRALDHPFDPI